MKGNNRFLTLCLISIFYWLLAVGSPPFAGGAQFKDVAQETNRPVAALVVDKKLQSDRAGKMLKIYKALRPQQAAMLIDRLDEGTAAEIMNSMDQKTLAKLIPHLNPQRVVKWTRESLAGK